MLTDALNEMKRKSGKTLSQISEECNIPKGTLNKVGYSTFVVDRRLSLSLAHWCLPPLF